MPTAATRPARQPGGAPGVKPGRGPPTRHPPVSQPSIAERKIPPPNRPSINPNIVFQIIHLRTFSGLTYKPIRTGSYKTLGDKIRYGCCSDWVGVFWRTLLVMNAALPGGVATGPPADSLRYWTPHDNWTGPSKHYCQTKAFEPQCDDGEVVVMTYAKYGRMETSECVVTDYGFVGCGNNVLDLMDYLCSGRYNCAITIPEESLENRSTDCPPDIKSYLNASYVCVSVQRRGCRMCVEGDVAKVNAQQGYLASIVSTESDQECGLSNCPWKIEVESGQKINITLLDFTESQTPHDGCSRVAVIKDPSATSEQGHHVCIGQTRISSQYLSLSNSVTVSFILPILERRQGQVLLYYEAVGCPDWTTPEGMWQKRHDDLLEVGCGTKDIGHEWSLKCIGSKWHGNTGKCPAETLGEEDTSLPLGVLIAIVVGIALVIGVLILTIGVVCLKRHQHGVRHNARPEITLYVPASQDPEYREEISLQPSYYDSHKARGPRPPVQPKPPHAHGGRENLYARRMESRPLPSIPNIHEQSQQAEDSDGSDKIQVFRTNSGKEHYHYHPRVVMRTTSGGSARGVMTPPAASQQPSTQVPATPTGSASGSGSGSGSGSVGQGSRSGSKSGSISGGTAGVAAAAAAGSSSAARVTPPVAGAAAAGPHGHTGPASGTPTPASCKDDPQYFVLDPDQEGDPGVHARRAARQAAANGQPEENIIQAPGHGVIVARGPQKSPEEENAENINKETLVSHDARASVIPERQTLPAEQNANSDTSEDLEVWVLMLRSQNYYIV